MVTLTYALICYLGGTSTHNIILEMYSLYVQYEVWKEFVLLSFSFTFYTDISIVALVKIDKQNL